MHLPRLLPIGIMLMGVAGAHGAATAPASARTLAKEAMRAYQAKDFAGFLAKMEQAVALRPDYPRMLVNLAAAQALTDRPAEAVATLGRLADLGLHSAVDKSSDFAALRDRGDFKAVVARLTENLRPRGDGEIAFSLPQVTGLIEGIAWREKTGEFFFGDVHHRTVWVREPKGKVRRFTTPDDGVFGVFGLAVDEARGALWAATTADKAMGGYTAAQAGAASLVEFDLETGRLRRVARLPADQGEHVLGDLTLAPDGTVFASDSGVPVLWRLAPRADTPEAFLEDDEFMSLQGLAVTPDSRTLFLADYANGLLRVDLATRRVRRLESPPSTTLLGIDGLALTPDGTLLAVQNGVRPLRVLKVTLDAAGATVAQVTVLESAHLNMADPTLGCVASGQFHFIGNAGWSRFEAAGAPPNPPRPVPVFRTKF
jgi:sugar lactone lactonase YvrE